MLCYALLRLQVTVVQQYYFLKLSQVNIASRLFWRIVVEMQAPVVKIEGNIGTGKTTHLQKFQQSLSHEDQVTIKIEHESVKQFQKFFYGNDLINTLEYFYKNPRQHFYLPNLCTIYLSSKNGNTRNCSTSLQGYCHGSQSWCQPDIYHCEQGSVHKIRIFISDRKVPMT